MRQEVVKKALNALAAIGAVKREPSPPSTSAGPVQDEPFPTYAWDFGSRHTDPYWSKVLAAWRQIASHDYLPGAMQWAQKHHPDRYHYLTTELPAAWERLWDAAAPLDDFQAALDAWVGAHEELIGLFPITQGTK